MTFWLRVRINEASNKIRIRQSPRNLTMKSPFSPSLILQNAKRLMLATPLRCISSGSCVHSHKLISGVDVFPIPRRGGMGRGVSAKRRGGEEGGEAEYNGVFRKIRSCH